MKFLILIGFFILTGPTFADLDDDIDFSQPKIDLIPQNPEKNKQELNQDSKVTTPPRTKNPAKASPQKSMQSDQKEPVQWSARTLKGNKDKKIFELTDNVVVTQGTMRLTAQQAVFYLDEADQVESIIAKGDVRINKDDDESTQKMASRSKEAHFFNADQRVELIGDATLWRGDDVIKGKIIKHSLVTGWIEVDHVEGVMKSEEPAQ